MLRKCVVKNIQLNWVLGLVLILVFTSVRFYLVLGSNLTKDYSKVSIIFLLMLALPFLLLNGKGLRHIGFRTPKSLKWLLSSFVIGAAISSLIYLIFYLLYEHSPDNAFVYISQSYSIPQLNADNKFIIFLSFSLVSVTYSPIGEEVFYRGFIHSCFEVKYGSKRASMIDSLAFSLAHLSHFGIVYLAHKWSIVPIPAMLWFVAMYISSRLFFYCKQKTDSIFGAIFAHAGFNIAMIYFIFYHIF